MGAKKVLFVGESCIAQSIEYKGYDSFTGVRYAEAFGVMREVFLSIGVEVTHIPCHRVPFDFPNTLDGLKEYDAIMFSDVGTNTFLLHPDTTRLCKRTPNLLRLVKQYVSEGGGFCMIGGYMTYQGIEAKGKYKDSVIEEIMPVALLPYDDRTECPEGAELKPVMGDHPILSGIPTELPFVLGYNRTVLKPDATLIATAYDDPFIAVWEYGKGRTVAYTTDCAPHWAPPEMYKWDFYPTLWHNIVNWLAGE